MQNLLLAQHVIALVNAHGYDCAERD